MVAWWTSGGAVNRWKESWKVRAAFPALMALLSTVLELRFGCTVTAMAGAFYGVLALYVSYADVKCREVDDFIHGMLLLVGLLGAQLQQVPATTLAGVGCLCPCCTESRRRWCPWCSCPKASAQGTVLAEEDLKLVDMPVTNMPQRALTEKA